MHRFSVRAWQVDDRPEEVRERVHARWRCRSPKTQDAGGVGAGDAWAPRGWQHDPAVAPGCQGEQAAVIRVRRALGETKEASKHGVKFKLRSCSELMGKESPRTIMTFVGKNHSEDPPSTFELFTAPLGNKGMLPYKLHFVKQNIKLYSRFIHILNDKTQMRLWNNLLWYSNFLFRFKWVVLSPDWCSLDTWAAGTDQQPARGSSNSHSDFRPQNTRVPSSSFSSRKQTCKWQAIRRAKSGVAFFLDYFYLNPINFKYH